VISESSFFALNFNKFIIIHKDFWGNWCCRDQRPWSILEISVLYHMRHNTLWLA